MTRTVDTARPATKRELTLGERLRDAADFLESIAADRALLDEIAVDDRTRLLKACRQISNPDPRARRRLNKAKARQERVARVKSENRALDATGIRELRSKPVFTTPNIYPPKAFAPRDADGDPEERETVEPRRCYVCKEHYSELHPFYDQLCPACADFNFRKRTRAGGLARARGAAHRRPGEDRVSGGDQAAAFGGAADRHHALSARLARPATRTEPDFAEWGDRLEIFGLDLRHTPSVEAFCHEMLTTRERLDFIVNNACQTVRRPPGFYEHMMEDERAALSTLPRGRAPAARGLRRAAPVSHAARGGPRIRRTDLRDQALAGLERAAELSQVALLAEDRSHGGPLPRRAARPGLAAGRLARPQLLAPAARGGLGGRAARSAARQCRGALRLQRAVEAADAAHSGARQAHRQRLGGRGPVLPPLQDHPPPAHQHGEGGAQHDDPHFGGRLPRRRHPHEQRRHRLGDRRGPGRDRRAQDGRSTASTRRSTSSTARRASSIPSSPASTPASTSGGSFLKDYRPTDW